jgi:hypothetical protein
VERITDPAEKILLRLVMLYPSHYAAAAARLGSETLQTTPAREIWRALGAALTSEDGDGARFDRAAFVDGLDPTLATVARTLLASTDPLPDSDAATAQAIDQSLLTLERARLHDRLESARARLSEAEASDDETDREALQREVLELQRRRLELDRAVADSSLLARRRIHAKPSTTGMEVAHGD